MQNYLMNFPNKEINFIFSLSIFTFYLCFGILNKVDP